MEQDAANTKGRIFYLGEGKLQFDFSFSWLVASPQTPSSRAATGVVVLSGSLSISLLAIEKAG
ncbi:MAG: hypothetical protein BECKG1743D_GA0114223_104533 [Candidatus Kentron sp. G]|nr:MAG: hypothetical protein BECKG1743E_GA0114224_105623 [Candidatus Kentron sp. G]VFN03271.1 MAG: hypothetical protein BECKG1743D_GA0114223_104533 [Candidatus Kentron sp. G]VFN04004.1 MAG: hypothetical protein BECKG1743F_GA0114225_108752 [Candidatus Kentron sp. G]